MGGVFIHVMHERNGAQLIFLAALGAVNCLFSAGILILREWIEPALGVFGALTVAAAWGLWLSALRSWIRSVRVVSRLERVRLGD